MGQRVGDPLDHLLVVQLRAREVDRDVQVLDLGVWWRQAANWPRASSSTQSPISTISPLSSASGMNLTGGMMPCVGCDQRTSASMPTTLAWGRRTMG